MTQKETIRGTNGSPQRSIGSTSERSKARAKLRRQAISPSRTETAVPTAVPISTPATCAPSITNGSEMASTSTGRRFESTT